MKLHLNKNCPSNSILWFSWNSQDSLNNPQHNSAAHTGPDTIATTMATTTPKVQPTGTCRFEEKKLLYETFKFGASNNLITCLDNSLWPLWRFNRKITWEGLYLAPVLRSLYDPGTRMVLPPCTGLAHPPYWNQRWLWGQVVRNNMARSSHSSTKSSKGWQFSFAWKLKEKLTVAIIG